MHDDAYDELLAATPPGWWVGRPSLHDERNEWQMYAFDPAERPITGRRRRAWTAVAQTEEGVIRKMPRCLREIAAGRVPKCASGRSDPLETAGDAVYAHRPVGRRHRNLRGRGSLQWAAAGISDLGRFRRAGRRRRFDHKR
jgi:hypothetical protein